MFWSTIVLSPKDIDMFVSRFVNWFFILLFTSMAFSSVSLADFPKPKSLGPVETYGRDIQRTMKLLATSTLEKPNTVRILFYGQSITEQSWTNEVADDLRKRFPHANLVIENRAIGGHSSQILWRTAEADLYPFYPDLLIFYVYGDHERYSDIIRRVRERTTAEVVLLTDHFNADASMDEETDPTRLTPSNWAPWFSYQFLPSLAKKYRCELVDQRKLWRQYLLENNLKPSDLLRDTVHLNDHGNFLMAQIVKAYLRYQPSASDDAWRDLVTRVPLTAEANKATAHFDGNRIDLVLPTNGISGNIAIKIDGKNPSEFPECYAFTRSTGYRGTNWPCLLRVQRGPTALQIEEWTLSMRDFNEDYTQFGFSLSGSKTGPDGEGHAESKFVSQSGRIVIEPEDWNLAYCKNVYKLPIHDNGKVSFTVVPMFVDAIDAALIPKSLVERTITVAQGLNQGKHFVELTMSQSKTGALIVVHKPPFSQTEAE
jgi:hypothetical protein